ncbi:MAG TPA: SDR family oxidoreductase [Albitalea sp.]
MKAAQARVVLTGATGGIGCAAASALLQAGASVMLVGRSPAGLSKQARELVSRLALGPERVSWFAADLDDGIDVDRLREAAGAFGANVLVLGAGLPSFGRFDMLDPLEMRQVLRTNLLSPMLLAHALLPGLRRQAKAQLICIGSALGRIGLPGYSVYSATKFGLRGFAEALRRELADTAVRVQYLGPRSTRTAFNDARVEAYNLATGTAMDDPERVARALLRLLEDEAAERFVGLPEALAVRLNGFAPAWLDGAFAPHRRSLPASFAAGEPGTALSPGFADLSTTNPKP